MTQIYHLRLMNGDELFGTIEKNTNPLVLRVGHPLCTADMETEGAMTIGLMDYLPFSGNDYCDIQKSHIMTCTQVHDHIEEFYHLSKHFTELSNKDMIEKIRLTCLHMSEIIEEDKQVDSTSFSVETPGVVH